MVRVFLAALLVNESRFEGIQKNRGGLLMKKKILQLLCALGTLLALSASAGACVIFSYQPQVPNELVKK